MLEKTVHLNEDILKGVSYRVKMEDVDESTAITDFSCSTKNDKNHERAVSYFKISVKRGVIFVLGKHVLIEYVDE